MCGEVFRTRKKFCTSEGGLPTERGSLFTGAKPDAHLVQFVQPFAGRIPVRAVKRVLSSLKENILTRMYNSLASFLHFLSVERIKDFRRPVGAHGTDGAVNFGSVFTH